MQKFIDKTGNIIFQSIDGEVGSDNQTLSSEFLFV